MPQYMHDLIVFTFCLGLARCNLVHEKRKLRVLNFNHTGKWTNRQRRPCRHVVSKQRAPPIDSSMSTDMLTSVLILNEVASCLQGFQEFMGFLSGHNDSIDYGVERRAVTALNTEKMPGSRIVRLFAVVASNVHHACQLRRYGLKCHTCRHGIPCWHHAFTRFRSFLTNGTPGIMSSKLPKALPVNGMAARHFMRSTPRTEKKLLTNWTVGLVFSTLAIVV
jgi:hypothetical protein